MKYRVIDKCFIGGKLRQPDEVFEYGSFIGGVPDFLEALPDPAAPGKKVKGAKK